MTKNQTAELLLIIHEVNQAFKVGKQTTAAWHELLGDLDFSVAKAALKMVLQERDTAFPTPGMLRKAASELVNARLPGAGEAWGQVHRAMRRWGLYDAECAKENCDAAVWQAVECLGWREMCLAENQEVLRAQFRGAYESFLVRRTQLRQLSPDIRKALQNTKKELPKSADSQKKE